MTHAEVKSATVEMIVYPNIMGIDQFALSWGIILIMCLVFAAIMILVDPPQ